MLHPERIFEPHAAEMLRRKMRNAGELERFLLRKGVADFDGAVIVKADDVAGIGFFDVGSVLRHENRRVGQRDFLADAVMDDLHAALKLSRADPQEGDAITMRRIHVGLDFKNKSGKILFLGFHGSGGRRSGGRRRRDLHERIEQFFDAEVVDGAAEENRRLAGFQIFLQFKRIGRAFQQRDFLAQFIRLAFQQFIEQRIGQIVDGDAFFRTARFPRRK